MTSRSSPAPDGATCRSPAVLDSRTVPTAEGTGLDLDGFIAAHRADWDRLEALVRTAERSPTSLGGADVTLLVDLYRRVASHLSTARTRYRDPATVEHLTRLTGRAHAVVYGTRPRTWRAVLDAATTTFPAAVWHLRRFALVAALVFLAGAVPVALWLVWSPEAAASVAPPEVVRSYLEEDFEAYYSSEPAAQFAATVFTNNVRVGILAFAAGIAWCLPTAAVLLLNGANLGVAAGLFHAHGRAAPFWGLILPHGLLELTAVFVAGGTGLALGWALVAPGDRPRTDALREEAQRAVVVVLGLIVVFGIAGVIEGFVTGSTLPTWARVAIGVAAELAFLGWVREQGRAAASRGLTGALGERQSRPSILTSR